jgi:hypothetical protein
LLSTLCFLCSCNTPEARLARLQHEFWEKFARQDFFEVRLKNEVLHWPLPPAAAASGQQKSLAESLQQEAKKIDKEGLSEAGQKQLAQLMEALDDCVAHAGASFFDPSRCVVSGQLQQFSDHPELPVLLEKIPAYYAQIEERWQIPEHRFVAKTVDASMTTLDVLHGLAKNSGSEGVSRTEAARSAIKDFIGLCQSAMLVPHPLNDL